MKDIYVVRFFYDGDKVSTDYDVVKKVQRVGNIIETNLLASSKAVEPYENSQKRFYSVQSWAEKALPPSPEGLAALSLEFQTEEFKKILNPGMEDAQPTRAVDWKDTNES